MRYLTLFLVCSTVFCAQISAAAEAPGPVAEWKLEEGQGNVLRDSSGNGHDATISGATWVKQGDGFALDFDGMRDFFESSEKSPINISGPITIELWMKPIACGWEDPTVLSSTKGYELVYSNRGLSWWSVDSRRYDVGGRPELGGWNHLVGTFNGKRKSLWLNGRLTASQPCAGPKGKDGKFVIGSAGEPSYRGLIGSVRLFDRAISSEEIHAQYKAESAKYGVDPAGFENVKLTPFYYLDRGEVVVDADYSALRPLAGKAEIEVSLASKNDQDKILDRKVLPVREVIEEEAHGWVFDPGSAEATLHFDPVAGTYTIRATLRDEKGTRPTQEVVFDYPAKQHVASPTEVKAGDLPARPAQPQFTLKMENGGGFSLLMDGVRYPFESKISWPNGDFNRLSASDEVSSKGETTWKVEVSKSDGSKHFSAKASGSFYTIDRQIEVRDTHVIVKDTITNTTDKDLGLLIYNETPIREGQEKAGRLSGYEGGGRQFVDSPGYRSSSVFVKDTKGGFGVVPMDDVFVIQSVLYAENGAAGIGTENFALAAGKSYALEWVIYPTGGDYWDFLNTFRQVEKRVVTLDNAPGYVTYGGSNRRQVVDDEFIADRGIKRGIITNLAHLEDDFGISAEGFEFIDFPKEIEKIKQQSLALKLLHPGIKLAFHNAHTLYATNDPNKFADSRIVGPNGQPKRSGGEGSFSKERIADGWAWGVFYPVPGNSFHKAMMKSVDIMMDQMGMDGVFVDGFLLGYGGPWTYDGRWDGHSAEMDLKTKTIKRKMGSVLLLMQPSMIEYARKIRDRGGFIIANGAMITRSVANEKYILFDAEIQAGPECHFAPTLLSLGSPPFRSEQEIYFDILDKLRWGVVFLPFHERMPMTYPSLGAMETPITFEEIRSGVIHGKERIVTMNSGVYGWDGRRELHLIHKFDARGAATANDFVTTVDKAGVRTKLDFAKNESAVIEPLPATLETDSPVNVRILKYGPGQLNALVNGNGNATLELFVGTPYGDWREGVFTNGGVGRLDVGAHERYQVSIGGATSTVEEQDGTLLIPLKLAGEAELSVAPAPK